MNRIIFLCSITLTGLLMLNVSGCSSEDSEHKEGDGHSHEAAKKPADGAGKQEDGKGDAAQGHDDEHSRDTAHKHSDDEDKHGNEEHGEEDGHDEHKEEHGHGDEDSHGEKDEHGHGHGEEGGHAELSAEQIESSSIGLAQAGQANIHETLSLYGVIVPNADRVQQVSARFPGVVQSINKQVGDLVREGDTLAVIESNESLESYSLKSRINGVVAERDANIGEQADDKVLFTVIDLSTVWAEVSLFPHDADQVQVGQSVRISGAKTRLQAEGKVIHVTPVGNRENQTQTARVLLDNPGQRFKPGLFVNAEVTVAETAVPLAVQNAALQTLEDKTVVFVQGKEGFEPRPVTLGRSDSNMSEVLSGLKAGETYVTRNSFILKSELGKEGTEHSH